MRKATSSRHPKGVSELEPTDGVENHCDHMAKTIVDD